MVGVSSEQLASTPRAGAATQRFAAREHAADSPGTVRHRAAADAQGTCSGPVGASNRDAGAGGRDSAPAPSRGSPAAKDGPRVPLRRGRPWVPRLIALLVALAGIINIVSAVTPSMARRLEEVRQIVPGAVTQSAAAVTVAAGILLLFLASALRRRKRRAFQATLILLAVSAVLHVVKGLDIEEALVEILLVVLLVVTRKEFYAKGDPRTRFTAVWVALLLVVLDIGIGLALVHLRMHRVIGPHPFSDQITHVLFGMVGISGPLRFTHRGSADLVAAVLLGLGILTVGVVAYLVLRAPHRPPILTAHDEARMRALLERFGACDSLGYFALRRDKSVIWSPSGKACVAFRVVSGVMLASGDPLGDNEAWPGAIQAFLQEATEHAWIPAVIGCSERGGIAYTRAGLTALELGDEAVIELTDFTLDGRAMRNVRQAVGRVERAGYTCSARRLRDIPAAELALLREQSARWRGTETERGFSMALGRFGDPRDGECVTVTAFRPSPEGPVLSAFLNFVPWGKDGLSLDLMRRDRAADNGLNELLIVSALRAAPALGVRRMSLNFAAFRSAIERGERLGAGPLQRAWRWILVFLSRWFQIDSLYRFNAKFRPGWEPRFICYPGAGDLPRIAVAMLQAEAFLVWPFPRPRRGCEVAARPGAAETA
jgi:lysyl-tRNA synthetase class 2